MPIIRTAQKWQVGEVVKVGFLVLKVTGFVPTPNDHRPDQYQLESSKGVKYTFTPHYGLKRTNY